MENKKIKISNVEFTKVSIEKLEIIQGDLKSLSDKNYMKLKDEILNHGFRIPFFIWKNKKAFQLIDGSQRVFALRKMQAEGINIDGEYPACILDCNTKKEAGELILAISSQYGEVTGLQAFADEFLIDLPEIEDRFTFDMPTLVDDCETDMPELKDGDKQPIQQLTFTVSDEQAEVIKEKLKDYKNSEHYKYIETFGNENANGNALYGLICQE